MENAAQVFKNSIDKSFGSLPKVNSELMKDALKYKSMAKESEVKKVENKEATGTGSSGQFSQPLFSGEEPKKVEATEAHESKIRSKIEKVLKEKLGRKPKKEELDDLHIKVIEKLYEKSKKDKKDMKKAEAKESSYEKSARRQFAKDLQSDKDFEEFKKNAKYFVDDKEHSFGTPNVTSDDVFVNKRRYGRVGKSDDDLEKIEATEATGSGSVGAYETPAAWAKSSKKKDWRGASKTQIPGGSFVSVKKKCKSFPYCNQGDINALNFFKNESVKKAISQVAKKLNINENVVKAILDYEYEKHINSNIYNKK